MTLGQHVVLLPTTRGPAYNHATMLTTIPPIRSPLFDNPKHSTALPPQGHPILPKCYEDQLTIFPAYQLSLKPYICSGSIEKLSFSLALSGMKVQQDIKAES